MLLTLTNNRPYPMAKTLQRRLRHEKFKLAQSWALLHREVSTGDRLETYVKSLRRCDRLQNAIQNLTGGQAV